MNLKDRELVNMKIAELADVPVFLVADIDRGGVFASIVGTLELLTVRNGKECKGIMINKFRGDISLFTDGVKWLEEKTGIPVLGVLPYVHNHMIDSEDSLSINEFRKNEEKRVILILLSFSCHILQISVILNLFYTKKMCVFVLSGMRREFGHPDAVIIPGTKSTIRDLQFLKEDRSF